MIARVAVVVGVVLAGLSAASAGAQSPASESGPELVFSGEDNRLNAYDAVTGEKQTVIPSAADAAGVGLDINAEICFVPDGVAWKPDGEIWFIAGEDTEQGAQEGVIKQGWGFFRLTGTGIGDLAAEQVGKLVPDDFATVDDNPENFGCGVLPDGRVVTGDVGDQFPHAPATGQLIVWFPTADDMRHVGPDRNDFDRVDHCKIDASIGTAGGIEIDGTDVLIASNRPDLETGRQGGIWRYDTTGWPTAEEPGCSTDPIAETRIGRTLFIEQTPGLLTTPSDIVHSGRDSYFISSVFTGQIAEYSRDGEFVRFVLLPGFITPFGIGVDSAGNLWAADIGLIGPIPGPGQGSVAVIRFGPGDVPLPPETIDDGLEFPDGIGVVTLPATGPSAPGSVGSPEATGDVAGRAHAAAGGSLPASGATIPVALAAVLLAAALGARRLRA